MKGKEEQEYLICEHKIIYLLLMMNAGMMGAYTFNIRGGVFCNAQTANIVIMSIAFGKGNWSHAFYYLIPISAYLVGTIVSEALPSPVKRYGFLRWDTWLIAIEFIVLLIVGFIPLSVSHQVVQIIVNFLASMQYNTFRQAEGIPMATTFCTNHVRQVGIAITKVIRKKDRVAFERGMMHLGMLISFIIGGFSLTYACDLLQEQSIWIALIPLGLILVRLVHADLIKEHEILDHKPSGH